jgi:alpha-beta hydrolase superfamily lysophospholipase
MKSLFTGVFVFLLLSGLNIVSADTIKKTITFPSKDGLLITADTYTLKGDARAPVIVLFHQAGWSRGEYLEIAPELNALGFNCMAVDQRSGGKVNETANETVRRAQLRGTGTTYVDALQDIEAALLYARRHYKGRKLIAWGSSYSAALVVKLAGDKPELQDGVVAFAPGEYFVKLGQSAAWIQESARQVRCPVFMTSARNEQARWSAIFETIPAKNKTAFLPASEGNHGSRALWKQFKDSEEYWRAVERFLTTYFLP